MGDEPQALALEEAADPANTKGPWWFLEAAGRPYHARKDIAVTKDTVPDAEAAPYSSAVSIWAKRGGSVHELQKLAVEGRHSVVLQICQGALEMCSEPRCKVPRTKYMGSHEQASTNSHVKGKG